MSHVTAHTYRGFSIRFDELEPQGFDHHEQGDMARPGAA